MRRIGYILAALLALGGTLRADQGWQDNQDGQNFACYDVGSFSANNLTSGGRTYSNVGTGEIVNSNPAWWSQLAWYVDPQSAVAACSDANTGLTSSVPLCTMAEVARRTNGATYPVGSTACIVWLESNMNSSDSAYFNFSVTGVVATTSNSPFGFDMPFTIIGVPADLGFSGMMSSVQNGALGSTSDIHFTDSGIPTSFTASGFLANNVILKRTNGTVAYAWPVKDLGSKTLRSSQWNATASVHPAIANGDTYRILQLPNFHGVQFAPSLNLIESYVQVSTVSDDDPAGQLLANSGVVYTNSTFEHEQFIGGLLSNCQFTDAMFLGPQNAVGQGGFLTSGSFRSLSGSKFVDVDTGSDWQMSDEQTGFTTFEAYAILVDVDARMLRLQAQFFDVTANAIVGTLQGAGANIITIGGASNARPIFLIANSTSRITYANAPLAGMTSGTQISLLGTGYAVADLPVADIDSGSYISPESPAVSVTSAGCAQFSTSGTLSSTGTACGTGSGGVTSAAGTAQRVSVSPTTGSVVVDTIGGFYSGAVSGGNEDLGTTLTNGLVCNDTTAGIAVLRSCVSGTDYPAVGVATPGSCTNCSATINANGQVTAYSSGAGSGVSSVTGTAAHISATPTTGAVVVDLIATAVTPGSYTYAAFTVDADGRLTAASSGTTPVTSVTGTSGQILCTPTTVNPVCSLVATAVTPGSYTNVSLTVDALGRITAASNGTAPVTSVGVTAPITTTGGATPTIGITGGANQVQVGTGTNIGGFSDFLWKDSTDVFQVGTTTTPATGVNQQFNGTNAQGVGWLRVGVNGIAGDLDMAADLTTNGPFLTAHTDPSGNSTVNAGSVRMRFGGNGFAVDTSPATAIGSPRTWTQKFQVPVAGGMYTSAIVSPATPSSGILACYGDSTSKNIACKNDAGTVNHGIQTTSCLGSRWINQVADNGISGCTQPAFTDINGSAACSQLPALTGGVTSSAGSCATTVASVPCGALPAFGGDLSSAGGTCSVQVQAIEETSGPARLAINAIPDLGGGGFSILNRPGATATVVGSTLASLLVGTTVPCGSLPTFTGGNVASTGGTCALNITPGTLRSSLAYYDASVNPILGGGFLATSSSSSTLSTTDIPYPLGIAAVNGRLRINVLANNIVTSLGTGVITFAVFLNGSNSGLSTTALTTVAGGTQLDTGLFAAFGSTAVTDGWSVKVTSTGTFVSGSITFTAVLVLGY